MSLDPKLLQIRVCPKCRGDVEYDEKAGEVRCTTCRLAYRVEDDIPIMLTDEATPY